MSVGHLVLGNVSSEKTDSLLLFAQLSSPIGEGGKDEQRKEKQGRVVSVEKLISQLKK